MKPIRTVEVCPDGVPITINMRGFVSGASVFIPAINTTKAVDDLVKLAHIDKEHITKRVCIENGKYGVRVWRMK
jgi:CO/xanthine dehydrogenase Mo-binding subunit|tara:strand:- start:109 stop:330 length:222 start_codon:yes stop_codon:yes gene_type:complete